uniref:Uncharacterized protein n=1 Tax=Nelumbo nucifera TaxID=4432 RepID=A0A822ZKB3_NELNU|nr:TPA_asm: hypothetical protein HUJ06_002261 [Nelumbo nucifera]
MYSPTLIETTLPQDIPIDSSVPFFLLSLIYIGFAPSSVDKNLGLDVQSRNFSIFTKRRALTHLDIQGYWSVKLEGDLEDKCNQLVVFNGPWDDDYDDARSSENEGDCADVAESSSSDSD